MFSTSRAEYVKSKNNLALFRNRTTVSNKLWQQGEHLSYLQVEMLIVPIPPSITGVAQVAWP